MFQSLRGAAIGAALAACAMAAPASAAIYVVSFTGTADANYVRTTDANGNFVDSPLGNATLTGSLRFDTALLPANAAAPGDDFGYAATAAFATTGLTLTPAAPGGEVPAFGGTVLSQLLYGAFGPNGYVDFTDDRLTIEESGLPVNRYGSAGFHLFTTGGPVGQVTVDGAVLPDFAALTGLGFELYSEEARSDADGAFLGARRVVAAGTIAGVTVTQEAAAVPEPATWATMLIGFGAVGVAARRRRTAAAA